MNFLNVGPFELMMIMVIAILVVGPQRMVEIVRTVGRMAGQLRRLSNEFTSTLQSEIWSAEQKEKTRQAADDIASNASSPLTTLTDVQSEVKALERETRQALEKAITGQPESLATEDSAAQKTETAEEYE